VRAAAARAAALAIDPAKIDDAFAEALSLHEQAGIPFELARTELCYGERLRRARRLSDARRPLRSALATFERLGAVPWADRARKELAASGERSAPSGRNSRIAKLTGQELQVALLVADGATNREAAAALFVSPKTIEGHLGRAYAKLGVRSRTELARLLTDEPNSLTAKLAAAT
jgi:DNA-binding CsgD family transcriptional regulator